MKKNELIQIKGLSIKELKDKAKSLKDEIANLSLDKNMKKLKDTKSVFKKRKDLAQVLTVLRQKEMLEQLSVLGSQLSDRGQPVVGKSVGEEKTDHQKTDTRKSRGQQ